MYEQNENICKETEIIYRTQTNFGGEKYNNLNEKLTRGVKWQI